MRRSHLSCLCHESGGRKSRIVFLPLCLRGSHRPPIFSRSAPQNPWQPILLIRRGIGNHAQLHRKRRRKAHGASVELGAHVSTGLNGHESVVAKLGPKISADQLSGAPPSPGCPGSTCNAPWVSWSGIASKGSAVMMCKEWGTPGKEVRPRCAPSWVELKLKIKDVVPK